MSKVTIVVGGQFGSECKGAVVGRLHRERPEATGVRVGGSQAGHTVIDDYGKRWALRHVPAAVIASEQAQLVIGQGSEIDLNVLEREVEALERAGYEVKGRLSIDQEATVVEDRHQQEEGRISTGSTKKGVGAARAARAMRKARRMVDFEPAGYTLTDTTQLLRDSEQEVIIEGVQGYGLGSHAGYYPFCTSSDCRASDFLAMAGLPPQECEVWVVLRVYPIRIAGNSGPLRGETSWQQLGLEPEITTVTRKIRRVGEWDLELAREAIAANGGPKVRLALMTADYKWPELKRKIENDPIRIEILDEIEEIEDQLGARIEMIGTSPSTQILLDYARLAT